MSDTAEVKSPSPEEIKEPQSWLSKVKEKATNIKDVAKKAREAWVKADPHLDQEQEAQKRRLQQEFNINNPSETIHNIAGSSEDYSYENLTALMPQDLRGGFIKLKPIFETEVSQIFPFKPDLQVLVQTQLEQGNEKVVAKLAEELRSLLEKGGTMKYEQDLIKGLYQKYQAVTPEQQQIVNQGLRSLCGVVMRGVYTTERSNGLTNLPLEQWRGQLISADWGQLAQAQTPPSKLQPQPQAPASLAQV